MLQILDRTLRILEKPLLAVSGLLIFLMMLHVVADVFFKYVFLEPITGTLEVVANYYMIAIVFLPLALVQRASGLIKVEVFTGLLGPRTTAALDAFATVLSIVFVGLMAWFALQEAIETTEIREKIVVGVSLLPVWPARWFVPVGTGVFLLALILSLQLYLRGISGRVAEEESDKISQWTD